MDWEYIFYVIDAAMVMILSLMTLLNGIWIYNILKKLKELKLRIEWITSDSRKEILIPQKKKRGRPKRKKNGI